MEALLLLLLLQAGYSLSQQTTRSPDTASPTTFLTSVVQATKSQTSPINTSQQSGYAAPSSTPGQVAGAAGSDTSSYSLGLGGLIAVIVVVVVVVVFGIVSVVLYVVAKRRQWNVRASIKRASRRLMGRRDDTTSRSEVERRKRSGMVASSKKPGTARPAGHKHGPAVEVKDVEKGKSGSNASVETTENKWNQRLLGNNWK